MKPVVHFSEKRHLFEHSLSVESSQDGNIGKKFYLP